MIHPNHHRSLCNQTSKGSKNNVSQISKDKKSGLVNETPMTQLKREVHSLSKVIKNKTLVAGHVERYY